MKIECPVCKGEGFLCGNWRSLLNDDQKKNYACELAEAGMPYRQIAKRLNVKSPSTIGSWVKERRGLVNPNMARNRKVKA